jgi:PilZ domain
MEAVEKDTNLRIEAIDFENRRYPRFDIHLPIEYCQFKSSTTHIGNISEGGLLIYLHDEMDVGQYLRLKLFFSSGSELDTIKILAEVVWKDNRLSEGREYYPVGVKFVDISSEDEIKLRNFLRSLSSPLDDLFCPFDILKVRFWIRNFINPFRRCISGRRRREKL